MPPRGGASKHRPMFHALVLASGFVVGGFMTQFARRFLPAGSVKFAVLVETTRGFFRMEEIARCHPRIVSLSQKVRVIQFSPFTVAAGAGERPLRRVLRRWSRSHR